MLLCQAQVWLKFANIVLERGITSNRDLWSWPKNIMDGTIARRFGGLTLSPSTATSRNGPRTQTALRFVSLSIGPACAVRFALDPFQPDSATLVLVAISFAAAEAIA